MSKVKGKSYISGSYAVATPEPRITIDKGVVDKKRRKNARTFSKARVGREMWENEKEEKVEFKIPVSQISYADEIDDANSLAARAIKDLNERNGDSLVGFDTEGSIKVLQLFFSFEGKEYAQIYQLNKIVVDGQAPEDLVLLLTDDRIIYSGKKVNDEIVDVLRMCGVKEEVVRKARIVEVQRCFEVIEMMARGVEKAHQYLIDGIYSPSYSLPKNPFVSRLKQRQEDLGLKTIYQFFFPQNTISKLLEMRCPLFCDWSCTTSEMTDVKLSYAAVDAGAGQRASSAGGGALKDLDLDWTDLVEGVNLEKARNQNGSFNSGRLARYVTRAHEGYLLNEEEEALKKFRQYWSQRVTDAIKHERQVRIERHERLSDLMEIWDSKHGIPKKLRFSEDYDDDDDDEFAVRREFDDDAEMEFEVVKEKFKVGTDMHKKACELLSDYNKQRSRIQKLKRGVDVAAEEKEEEERLQVWCKKLQDQGEEASGPFRPMDKESHEHFVRKERERKEKEADPERFWACRHLEDLVKKKTVEAETLIREREGEKERERRERENEEKGKKEEEELERLRKEAEEEAKRKEVKKFEAERRDRRRKIEEMRQKQKEDKDMKEKEKEETRLLEEKRRKEKEREEREKRKREAEELRSLEEEKRKEEHRILVGRLKRDWKKWEEDQKFRVEEETADLVKMEDKVDALQKELELAQLAVSKAKLLAVDRQRLIVSRRQAYQSQIRALDGDDVRDDARDDDVRDDVRNVRDDDVRDEDVRDEDVRDDCVRDNVRDRVDDVEEDDDEDGDKVEDDDVEDNDEVDDVVDEDDGDEDDNAEEDDNAGESSAADNCGPTDRRMVVSSTSAVSEDVEGESEESESSVTELEIHAEAEIEDLDGIEVEDIIDDPEGYFSAVDVSEPPPAKKRRTSLEYDINLLQTCKRSEIKYNVDALFSLTNNKIGPEYLLEVLSGIGVMERKQCISKHALAKLRSKEERKQFVQLLMYEQVLFKEYIGTLIFFEHWDIDPIVVIDHIHHPAASKHNVQTFIKKYSPASVRSVVTKVCELAVMPVNESVDWLRQTRTFPKDYLAKQQVDKKMKKEWLLGLARELCDIKSFGYPDEVRRLPFDSLIEPLTSSFKKGEVDVSDFVNEVESLCDECSIGGETLVGKLNWLLPDAARFWADKYNLDFGGQSSTGIRFENPKCNGNRGLHDLGRDLRMIHVDSKSEADQAIGSITRSKFVTLKVTFTSHKFVAKRFPLLTLRTDNRMIVLSLSLMQDQYVEDFLRRLRTATRDKRLLMRDPVQLHELARKHNQDFCNLVDADVIAKSKGWSVRSWEAYCEEIAGGQMCVRATVIPSMAGPSEVALQHERIRISLLYEFFVRFNGDIEHSRVQPVPKRLLGKRSRPR